jgi:hypothetical protein
LVCCDGQARTGTANPLDVFSASTLLGLFWLSMDSAPGS